jgi:adenosylcobinamide kinase / adenosylcobinamide-phosphate guanylyltransferase
MQKLIFITGGERSGKSSFAQQMALSLSDNPVYLATAKIWDKDFAKRVERHKSERNEQWTTIEEEIRISRHNLQGKVVVLDCVTLWLTNIFEAQAYDCENAIAKAQHEWLQFMKQDCTAIVVSNEIGMSLHAQNEAGRKFVELQGIINQTIAGMAKEAYLMISGISMKIK